MALIQDYGQNIQILLWDEKIGLLATLLSSPKTAFVRLFHAKYAFVLCRPRFGERKFCVGIYSKCQWDEKVKEEEVQHNGTRIVLRLHWYFCDNVTLNLFIDTLSLDLVMLKFKC